MLEKAFAAQQGAQLKQVQVQSIEASIQAE